MAILDIKEAVKIAESHFTAFFQGRQMGETLLEDFALATDGKTWSIGLSCDWHAQSGTASIGPGQRLFRILIIDAETGQVVGMKNKSI